MDFYTHTSFITFSSKQYKFIMIQFKSNISIIKFVNKFYLNFFIREVIGYSHMYELYWLMWTLYFNIVIF